MFEHIPRPILDIVLTCGVCTFKWIWDILTAMIISLDVHKISKLPVTILGMQCLRRDTITALFHYLIPSCVESKLSSEINNSVEIWSIA